MNKEEIFPMEEEEELDNEVTKEVMDGETASYSKTVSDAWKVVAYR